MTNFALKFGLMGLLAVTAAGTPLCSHAQTNTNAPLPGLIKTDQNQFPFRGKLTAIDTKASTITLSNQTFQVTTNTVLVMMGKRITLADAAEGDIVMGVYRKGADGKSQAVDIRFAPRHQPKPSGSETNTTTKATTP